jgi:hypothetical protein
MRLTRSEAARLRRYSPRERTAIRRALKLGCNWHGRLLSDCCCECDMIRFYEEQIGRRAKPSAA